MPGFKVELAAKDYESENPDWITDNIYGDEKQTFVYNYQWSVPLLFGDLVKSKTPLVYLKDVTLPSVTINKETYTGASIQYKFASEVIFEDVKMTFYDNKGLLSKLREWRESLWTDMYGINTASDYKKDSIILVNSPSGLHFQKYTLYGSWPSAIRYGDLTYTSSDVKFVDLTLTYDWALEEDITDKAVDISVVDEPQSY